MPGSMKGEKRGAAGSHIRKAKAKPPRKSADAVTGVKKPRKSVTHTKATEEYYRDIHRVINGETARDIQPRELMLKAMRYFDGLAEEHLRMAEWVLAQLTTMTAEQLVQADDKIAMIEARVREYYLIAVDIAYKAAPYVHARLSAVQLTGANEGPIEVIGTLLKEIDEANRGRPTWAPPTLELVANNG